MRKLEIDILKGGALILMVTFHIFFLMYYNILDLILYYIDLVIYSFIIIIYSSLNYLNI